MIYQPISVYPLSTSIDGLLDNTFSFNFSGDKLSAYQVIISENNSNKAIYTGAKKSVTKYNGDLVEIGIPKSSFTNGKDLLWRVVLWEDNPTMFVVSGVVQSGSTTTSIKIRQHPSVKANMYLSWEGQVSKITSYDYSTGIATVSTAFSTAPTKDTQYKIFTDFIESPHYYFKARTTPVVNINEIPPVVDTRNYTFSAVYNQPQHEGIKYHVWNLYDENDHLIDTTDKVFSSNLTYSFDGFLSEEGGKLYKIECIVETSTGVYVKSRTEEFLIDYVASSVQYFPTVEMLDDINAVKISWQDPKQSLGVATGAYSFDGGNVDIQTGQIYFDKINNIALAINESDFTVFTNIKLGDTKQGKIIGLIDDNNKEYYLELDGYSFYSNKNGVKTFIKNVLTTITSGSSISSTAQSDTGYVWIDTDTWDNSEYWVETKRGEIESKQFKVTILANNILIQEVAV